MRCVWQENIYTCKCVLLLTKLALLWQLFPGDVIVLWGIMVPAPGEVKLTCDVKGDAISLW